MRSLEELVAATAQTKGFSGVVRVDRRGVIEVANAYGYADRAHEIANTVDTQFGTASATKGFTALTVMALVERGRLELSTTARSLLRDDQPEIADDVTVEHLLGHRSGIGDYLDEDELDDMTQYAMPVPVHQLATTEDYLGVLAGHPTAFPAGEGFAYNNGGYVVLALLVERATGTDYHDLHRFWKALQSGRIVSPDTVELMMSPRSDWPEESRRYGLGFHLHKTGSAAWLEGYDAGVSFTSLHDPSKGVTYTVISNWTDGAWPIIEMLNNQLGL